MPDTSSSERREAARRMLAVGDAARAVDLLQGSAAEDPTGESLVLLGDAFFLLDRFDAAEAAWRAAAAAGAGDASLPDKLDRAAANVATWIAGDEPQARIFAASFNRDHLLGGPNPGDVGDPVFPPPEKPGFFERAVDELQEGAGAALSVVGKAVFHALTERAGAAGITDGVWTSWHHTAEALPEKLRAPLQILKLAFMRDGLFANNLVRPYVEGDKTAFWLTDAEPPEWARRWRTADGSWNDLNKDADGRYDPMVGAAWTRFFRNVGDDLGLESTRPRPNPATNPVNVRELSRALLAPKGKRAEVPFLNLWAGAWIQFMVHDWASHGTPTATRFDHVPLAVEDPLRRYGIDRLTIPATAEDPTRQPSDGDRPPTHVNEVTHWWEGSQLYGSDAATQRALRSGVGGRLTLTEDGFLPVDPDTGVERTGFVRNWWWASRCSTRSSPANTTPSATTSPLGTPTGTTSACSRRRASSTRR